MARRPTITSGKAWWEDFTFAPMATGSRKKSAQEFMQATEALPERLLIPMGGRFEYHWGYLRQKAISPESVESWVPLQDPKFTEPIWHVPALEHCPTFAGIVLLPFVAHANNPPRANLGFIWLPTAPDDVYGYIERLWLVTIRPIPRGAFFAREHHRGVGFL